MTSLEAADARPDKGGAVVVIVVVGAPALLIYACTRFTVVPGGDSGELMAMACQRGIAHPPGYPLLTMLGSAWLGICPDLFGHAPAAKLSLLAAVLGAASATLLSLAAAKFTSSAWAGVFAGGMFAFSGTVWKFSTHFEVFALNNFFVSLLHYLSIKYLVDKDDWIPYAGALACGLALTNQHTILLLEAPLILAVIISSRASLLRPRSLVSLAMLFCLGLAPYLYLPWAGAAAPRGSWGAVDEVKGFIRHLLRREYGSLQLYTTGSEEGDEEASGAPWHQRSLERMHDNGLQLLHAVHDQSLGLALVLGPLGACSLFYRRERAEGERKREAAHSLRPSGGHGVGSAIVACVAVYMTVFLPLANLPRTGFFEPILARFWMQVRRSDPHSACSSAAP